MMPICRKASVLLQDGFREICEALDGFSVILDACQINQWALTMKMEYFPKREKNKKKLYIDLDLPQNLIFYISFPKGNQSKPWRRMP